MLHRGFHTSAAELDRLLIRPTQAISGPPLLDETEIPTMWQWYLRLALINLVGWLVLFALVFLIANYMQSATSAFVEP
jgi:hypothetical protein